MLLVRSLWRWHWLRSCGKSWLAGRGVAQGWPCARRQGSHEQAEVEAKAKAEGGRGKRAAAAAAAAAAVAAAAAAAREGVERAKQQHLSGMSPQLPEQGPA